MKIRVGLTDKMVLIGMGIAGGFWILDNLAPLRQATPGITDRELVLFEPAAAYRSANGATLAWWIAEDAEEAVLEILDSSGEVIRTFTPADSAVATLDRACATPFRRRSR